MSGAAAGMRLGLASLALVVGSSTAFAVTWVRLSGDLVPPSRMGHAASVDPTRERMLIVGGIGLGGLFDDVWALSLDASYTWTKLTPLGVPPSGRWDHTAVHDPIGDRMLVFGGSEDTGPRNDVWALELADPPTWTKLQPVGTLPAARASHVAVFDAAANRMIVFGGFDGGLRGDVWELTLDGTPEWRDISPPGPGPTPRRDAVAAWDAAHQRMLVHGGNSGVAPFDSDTWILELSGEPAWTLVEPTGPIPDGAITHAGVFDPARNRFVQFGGNYHNRTWALDLDPPHVWTELQPDGVLPPGRIDHTLVYDAPHDRIVAFGGHTALVTLDDTWALGLGQPVDVLHRAPALGLRAFPNPARGDVTIHVAASLTPAPSVSVHDVRGRVVRELALPVAGSKQVAWDRRDAGGATLAAGLYFCRVRGSAAAERIVLLQPSR